jgi:hypothetical protein
MARMVILAKRINSRQGQDFSRAASFSGSAGSYRRIYLDFRSVFPFGLGYIISRVAKMTSAAFNTSPDKQAASAPAITAGIVL